MKSQHEELREEINVLREAVQACASYFGESHRGDSRGLELLCEQALSASKTHAACRCQSYNRPDFWGDRPEVCLPAPAWSGKPNGICVDACIADAIKMLWDNGIETAGCCCGHNRLPPSVIVSEHMDCERVKRLLAANDGRPWVVQQWRLVTA